MGLSESVVQGAERPEKLPAMPAATEVNAMQWGEAGWLRKGTDPTPGDPEELPNELSKDWGHGSMERFLKKEGLLHSGDQATLKERAWRLREALKTPEMVSPDLTPL